MKIAINTRFLLPGQLEGFGWYTHEIVRRMVLAHPEDEFVFFFDRPFDPQFIYADNVSPMVLAPRARFAPLFLSWFEWSVCRSLKKVKADVFFSPDAMCSLSSEVPVVMTCHDLVPLHFPAQIPWIHRDFLLHFLPRYLRRANVVITVSDFVREDIINTCGIEGGKIYTVYNACRAGFNPISAAEKQQVRARFSSGKPYFFYAGAIHPRKNIPGLIRAFDRFKQKTGAEHQLLLAGRFAWKTGPVLSAYEAAENQKDIHFLGYVSDDDLKLLTAAATALTYVSFSEGFGLPVLEAMHCDVPVITANKSSLPEIAGRAALLVDPYDEDNMAAGMEQLWRDPALAEQLVALGQSQRKKFDWDQAAEAVYALIKQGAMEQNRPK